MCKREIKGGTRLHQLQRFLFFCGEDVPVCIYFFHRDSVHGPFYSHDHITFTAPSQTSLFCPSMHPSSFTALHTRLLIPSSPLSLSQPFYLLLLHIFIHSRFCIQSFRATHKIGMQKNEILLAKRCIGTWQRRSDDV